MFLSVVHGASYKTVSKRVRRIARRRRKVPRHLGICAMSGAATRWPGRAADDAGKIANTGGHCPGLTAIATGRDGNLTALPRASNL
jgi:hypothetical protein